MSWYILYQHELKSFNKEATCYKKATCYKLVLSVFKTTFSKTGPKAMMCRDYKNFDQNIFSQ